MSPEIMGVSLKTLENPIRTSLAAYQKISNGELGFDIDSACKLTLTPDKPNSARSETDAWFRHVQIGKFYVIAFKPGDGTGSEVNYLLDDLLVDSLYPRNICVVPRNKTGVYHEGHLAIVRQKLEDVHAEPELFIGKLDLIGLDGVRVGKIGELGQSEGSAPALPLATFTVGYKDGIRFGDPHAVYSSDQKSLQVGAFLAISDLVHKEHPNVLSSLKPHLPLKS